MSINPKRQPILDSVFLACIVLCSLFLFSGVSVQPFSFRLINVNEKDGNVMLHAQVPPENGQIQLEIRERKGGTLIRKFVAENKGESKWSKIFSLQTGNYFCSLEFMGSDGKLVYQENIFSCEPAGTSPWLGDPLLISCPDERPILSGILPGYANVIRFEAAFFPGGKEKTPVRAVLFRREKSGTDLAMYVSISQIKEVLDKGMRVFSGEFLVSDLEPGEYLLELYLYSSNKLSVAVNRPFRFEWNGFHSLQSNPDSAFQLMEAICEGPILEHWRKLPEKEGKWNALLNFWYAHDPPNSPYPGFAMEQYFNKFADATKVFPKGYPIWEPKRMKTYLWYGKPDEQRFVNDSGQETEIWYYSSWGMNIPFKKAETKWKPKQAI